MKTDKRTTDAAWALALPVLIGAINAWKHDDESQDAAAAALAISSGFLIACADHGAHEIAPKCPKDVRRKILAKYVDYGVKRALEGLAR